MADQGRYTQLNETLARVQASYNEPSDAGLNSALTTFFNSFQDVSRHPESTGPRTLVQHYADDVARKFRDIYSTLSGTTLDIAEHIRGTIGQVNDLAKQIAALNVEVQKSTSVGGQSNDIADRRDSVVQELSKLVGAVVIEEQDGNGKKTGAVNLSVGGVPLVQGGNVVPIPSQFDNVRGQPVLLDGAHQIPIQSGELGGLIEASAHVADYTDDLNRLASTFITSVNAQHRAGYGLDGQTGRPLYSGTDASNIGLDSVVANDPQAIAAASAPAPGNNPAPGNGDNARAIADIASQTIFGPLTLQDYYGESVTKVGADAKSFDRLASNQVQVVQQLSNVRNSVSGVSMDEELSKMLAYQRAYQAAAKLLSTYDGLIESLINSVR
jgi:flagellar hook-associated protein 1 FlgK